MMADKVWESKLQFLKLIYKCVFHVVKVKIPLALITKTFF